MLLAVKAAVILGLAAVFGLGIWSLVSEVYVGHPRAVDGDTLVLHTTRVRLVGLDAPELGQHCGSKTYWDCGAVAKETLAERIGHGWVLCFGKGRDAYKRLLGRCYTVQGDVGRFMVSKGLAVTSGTHGGRYRRIEEASIAQLQGVWSGTFDFPREWRAKRKNAKRELDR